MSCSTMQINRLRSEKEDLEKRRAAERLASNLKAIEEQIAAKEAEIQKLLEDDAAFHALEAKLKQRKDDDHPPLRIR